VLRHYAHQAHLAGVREHGGTVGLDVLIEPQARTSLGQDGLERGLADLKRIAPQVVAVQLDEVEGIEEYAPDSSLVTGERSNEATSLPSQATASPSMMQERERRRANVSTISGKRGVSHCRDGYRASPARQSCGQ
jgi:hypothetical protein